jgi:LPXTG-motif cell wall-anchored protein
MKTPTTRRRFGAGALITGAVFLALGVFAPAAQADHVEADDYDGNPSCADLGFPNEFKIDNIPDLPAEGDYTPDTANTVEVGTIPAGFTITIDNVEVLADHAEFDWAANADSGPVPLDAVLVKASNGGNAFVYNPDVASDTDLQSVKDSISHISFCWGAAEAGTTTGGVAPTTGSQEPTDTGGALPETETPGSEVEGEVITAPAELPRTGDNDRSLFLVGMGLITIGAISMIARRELFIRS